MATTVGLRSPRPPLQKNDPRLNIHAEFSHAAGLDVHRYMLITLDGVKCCAFSTPLVRCVGDIDRARGGARNRAAETATKASNNCLLQ